MRIYVASSWKNYLQPGIVVTLRASGHEVYDFRNPPNKSGFGWEQVKPGWKSTGDLRGTVEPAVWREMLKHPIAEKGYDADLGAIIACEAIVYVLPCGKSASWELGYATALGKKLYVLALEPVEPELMFREATILTSMDELWSAFGEPRERY